MTILIAPDKFKGSLTSFEVCRSIAEGIKEADEHAEILQFPLADGGDGFAAVLQHYLKTEAVPCTTVDPLGRSLTATYQWSGQSKTAIVESSSACGLVLLKEEERNPLYTSTYGTGLMIKAAIEKGAQRIILGIGGTATNDAGTGILSALGFVLKDKAGNDITPCGKNLSFLHRIIPPATLPNIPIEIACDVQNTLYGPGGAAFVYAPQKGAAPAEAKQLDDGLEHFASVIRQQTGKDMANVPGSGAAGGIAAGLLPFLPVTLAKGIDVVMNASGISHHLPKAGIVFTGEGSIDHQSGQGKAVGRLCEICRQHHIPLIALCGKLELTIEEIKRLGITYVSSIVNGPVTLEECIRDSSELLKNAAARCMLFVRGFEIQ